MTTLQESRANARLDNDRIRDTDGEVLTRRAWVNKRLENSWMPVASEVPDTAAISRLEKELDYLRRVKWEPGGNPNWPDTKRYHAIKQLLADGPKKAEYRMVSGDICSKLTKTEYDYAIQKAFEDAQVKVVTERTHIGVHTYSSACPACAIEHSPRR